MFWREGDVVFSFILNQKKGSKETSNKFAGYKKRVVYLQPLRKQRSQQQVEKKKKSRVGLYIERFESFDFHDRN